MRKVQLPSMLTSYDCACHPTMCSMGFNVDHSQAFSQERRNSYGNKRNTYVCTKSTVVVALFLTQFRLGLYVIIVLATRQCCSMSFDVDHSQAFPKEEENHEETKGNLCTKVKLPSMPTSGLSFIFSTPFAVLAPYCCCACHLIMCSTSFNVDHSEASPKEEQEQEDHGETTGKICTKPNSIPCLL